MKRKIALNTIISGFTCILIVIIFVIANNRFEHWFVLPVCICGISIGKDAVGWIRGQMNLYDPVGILGVLGFHFFFLAPLLHVHWDEWMKYVQPLPDWRPWLGYMAVLNAMGILIYQHFARRKFTSRIFNPNTYKPVNYNRFSKLLVVFLALSFFLQVVAFAKTGGVFGGLSVSVSGKQEFYSSMGFLFMLSESFPILAAIGYICWVKRRNINPSMLHIAIFLLCFFVLQMLFGGLRGSRSATIWKLFWVVGIFHLAVKSLSRKLLICGAFFIVLFMYIYGIYKSAGPDTIYYLEEGHSVAAERTGRTFHDLFLGDFGRSDVQAYLLHNSFTNNNLNDYAYGRTYLGSVTNLIPKSIWPTKPATKVKEGTNALYGKGAWESGVRSSRVYGLAGEAILNFGFLAVPIVFSFLGIAVSIVRKYFYSLKQDDGRLLLLPFWVNFCVVMLTSDSSNFVMFVVGNGFLPLMLVLISLKNYKTINFQLKKQLC